MPAVHGKLPVEAGVELRECPVPPIVNHRPLDLAPDALDLLVELGRSRREEHEPQLVCVGGKEGPEQLCTVDGRVIEEQVNDPRTRELGN